LVEAAKSLLLILSALFPIVDPLGGSPIFLSMTREYSPSTRRALSLRIAMNSFFLLVGSYFIGTHILSFFGISIPVVQVGGGLIVISTGWALLKQGNDDDPKSANAKIQPKDPFHNAFYPLTLPLTVGPGSISVAITLGANAPHHQGFYLLSIVTAAHLASHAPALSADSTPRLICDRQGRGCSVPESAAKTAAVKVSELAGARPRWRTIAASA
jgi:MarC family membrane protein